jgi:hypothetical protein
MAKASQPAGNRRGRSRVRTPSPRAEAGHGDEKRRTEYDISAEDFIKIWQASASADEVFQKLGGRMSKAIIHARASKYRGAGVRLKKMPRRNARGLDVDHLNRLIAEIDARMKGESPPLDAADRVPVPEVPPPHRGKTDPKVVNRVGDELMSRLRDRGRK